MTTDLLAALVAIDSVNPALVPGGAGEAEIAAFVAAWLTEQGLEVTIDEPLAGRPSVVGVARGTGGGASLMLNAHLDTVNVDGMERPHEPVVRDGRLYGRGAYDMKGGLAAIMAAGAAAARDGLARRRDRHRGGRRGARQRGRPVGPAPLARRRLHRHRADAPARVRRAQGLRVGAVETRGRAAHGSRPDLGVDAIVGMAPALAGIPALQRRLQARPHPLLGAASLHASLIAGGQELSSYPERCVLDVERRTLPGESAQDVERELQELLALAREADPRLDTRLRMGLVREPSRSTRRRTSSRRCAPPRRGPSAPSLRSSATARGWTPPSSPPPAS